MLFFLHIIFDDMKVSVFPLSFLPETSEQVERWDNDALLEPTVRVDWSPTPTPPQSFCCLPNAAQPFYVHPFLFLLPHLALISQSVSRVITWGFIWLINAPSFWEISQRTWIRLPYLCTGAMVAPSTFYSIQSRKYCKDAVFFPVNWWKWKSECIMWQERDALLLGN